MQPIKVFLSSTYRDKDLRQVARETIDSLPGFASILVEESAATMRAPEQFVLERILEADLFVVVFGPSYGSVVPQRAISFTEYEFEIAAKAGKPVLAFIVGEPSTEPTASFLALSKRLAIAEHIFMIASAPMLRTHLAQSLLNLKERKPARDFEIAFDPELSEQEIKTAFEALADYYRACGGIGLAVEFEREEAEVREPIHA